MSPPTRLERAPPSLAAGRALLLKREDEHELGAFKWRGALPVLDGYRQNGATEVVTASTGNHGAASAWAAKRLGLRAIVYVPVNASVTKRALLERFGAEVRLEGEDLDEAKEHARRYAQRHGAPFFEDGAERAQWDGYGAIATEILDEMEEPPAAVVVPVGNGALLAGIGRVLGARSPQTRRIGVAARQAPVMVESWKAGRVVHSDRCDTIADGLAVRVAIPLAVEALAGAADEMLLVSERELAHAIGAFARAGIRVEAAAAAALAALPQIDLDGPVVLIVTGHNIDAALHQRALDDPDSFPE